MKQNYERLVMSLREKWIDTLYKSAIGKRRVKARLTSLIGIAFIAYVGLFVFASLRVDNLLGFPALLPTRLSTILSIPILAVGLWLAAWSLVHFIKVRGTPIPSIPPPKLVTTGPYARVRNPMHIGLYIFLFGLGILFRSVSLVSIFTPIFILLDVLELKNIEEVELERRLGKDYLEYKEKVPMFIPRLLLLK